MDAVNQVTHECFNALTQLRELEGAVGSPDLIHGRLSGFVEKMREKARELGMPERDGTDMAYAIVALCDEIAIDKPEPMHSFWIGKQLQYKFFDERINICPSLMAGVALKSEWSPAKAFLPTSSNFGPSLMTSISPRRVIW